MDNKDSLLALKRQIAELKGERDELGQHNYKLREEIKEKQKVIDYKSGNISGMVCSLTQERLELLGRLARINLRIKSAGYSIPEVEDFILGDMEGEKDGNT